MACRYPGNITAPEDLWELITTGTDAITPFPPDRGWDTEALYNPDPDADGTTYVTQGGFVTAAGNFDAAFFNISPREALAMDPQQRLLLETTWNAQTSPHHPQKHRHRRFIGGTTSDYLTAVGKTRRPGTPHHRQRPQRPVRTPLLHPRPHRPRRLVDTACSSSLVALHQAAQALRSGECTLALAGGVMVMADPSEFTGFSDCAPCPRTAAAKPSATAPTAWAWPKAPACSCWNDSPTPPQRTPRPRRHPRQRRQPGRRLQRPVRPNGPSSALIHAALANARLSAADVDASKPTAPAPPSTPSSPSPPRPPAPAPAPVDRLRHSGTPRPPVSPVSSRW
nr:polyketide synthase [Streptomyces tsukubensis]